MGGGGASEPVRVLAIFGSESGTAKAAIKGLASSLGKDGDIQIVDIKEGNSVGALETLKEKCAMHVGSRRPGCGTAHRLPCCGRLPCPAPGPPSELQSRLSGLSSAPVPEPEPDSDRRRPHRHRLRRLFPPPASPPPPSPPPSAATTATTATTLSTARYDFLLIATSSFGEGDPPDNYAGFLAKLLKGAKVPLTLTLTLTLTLNLTLTRTPTPTPTPTPTLTLILTLALTLSLALTRALSTRSPLTTYYLLLTTYYLLLTTYYQGAEYPLTGMQHAVLGLGSSSHSMGQS
jgi:hypothetical protein